MAIETKTKPGGGVAEPKGTETIDEGIEVILPDNVRELLDNPPAKRFDLPTTIEGAHEDDETAHEPAPEPEVVAEPVAAVKPPVEPATSPAPVAGAAPAQAPAPVVDPRAKRRADEALADLDRVDREVEAARARAQARPAVVPGVDIMPDEDWAKVKANAVKKAAAAQDFGEAVGETLDEIRAADKKRADAHKKTTEEQAKTSEWQAGLKALEAAAKGRYHDYDAVLEAADMWNQSIPPGKGEATHPAYNPAIAQRVYGDVDPPDKAYWIARAQIAKKSGKAIDATDLVVAPPAAAAPPAPAPAPAPVVESPAPVPVAPRDAAAIRRETRTEVLDQTIKASERRRGLDGIPDAGRPRSRFTLAELDRIQAENPEGYYALPENVRYYHQSGGATRG